MLDAEDLATVVRLSLGLAQVIAGAQDTDATLTLLAGFAIIVE